MNTHHILFMFIQYKIFLKIYKTDRNLFLIKLSKGKADLGIAL